MNIPEINLNAFNYNLPDERIAKHPLPERDQSNLLLYSKGTIEQFTFSEIERLLPPDISLVFNNTKVIPARLIFLKESGAKIEIFLLQPVAPSTVISAVMGHSGAVTWQCMIGNAKRWKTGTSITRQLHIKDTHVTISASRNEETNQVTFAWDNPNFAFVDIVEAAGQVPLPPYLNREPDAEDKPRYQTVYSKNEGAVAAPTAGLHFTSPILNRLADKGIQQEYLTLHVSAGTFQPIKVDKVQEHPMHSEQIVVTRKNLENLITAKTIVAVGTTSMRTLESLYWYGVKLLQDENATFFVEKLAPYTDYTTLPNWKAAFGKVLTKMVAQSQETLIGETEIFIFPGYNFRVCSGLITNFHQPGSTLILLVAAFIGDDWRNVYDYALANDFRFLSYGDSSLLWGKSPVPD